MRSKSRILATAVIVAACAASGCSKAEKKAAAAGPLAYIPADTPYAFVSIEPMPKGLVERLKEPQKQAVEVYVEIFKQSYKDYQLKVEEEAGEDAPAVEENKWIAALAAEFGEGGDGAFQNLGFDEWYTPTAFYGHGVLPVVRLGLGNPDKFEDFIARVEKRAEEKIPTRKVGDHSLWVVGDKKAKVAFGVIDGALVITGMPTDASDDMVAKLAGVTKPDSSLADTSTVTDLMKAKGYKPYGVGFVDSRQILNRVVEAPTGLDAELFSLLGVDSAFRDELTPVCKRELLSMAEVVPRMVFGITEATDDRMDFEYVVEVKEDIAKQMTGFAAPVPGLGQPADFLSFGMSFNLAEIQKFLSARILALKNDPYECEFLATDPSELDKAYMGINNPAAGMFQGIHGFNFMVDHLDVDKVSELITTADPEQPDIMGITGLASTAISAKILIAADNAAGLFGMAQMMVPPLAGLNMSLDGDPVRINEALPAPLPMDVYATMSENIIAISAGKDAASIPKSLLSLGDQKNPPLLAYSLDGGKYMKMLNAMFENPRIAAAMTEDDPEADIESMRKLFTSMQSGFGKMTFDLGFRDDGVVMGQSMQFVD